MPDSEDKALVDGSLADTRVAHPATAATQPPPLTGDLRRQAVPSIRDTVYQACRSIDAWLPLTDDNTVIYLEASFTLRTFFLPRPMHHQHSLELEMRSDGVLAKFAGGCLRWYLRGS
jgi:hypothetical protein